MDTSNGRIMTAEQANAFNASLGYPRAIEMKLPPTERQMGRNLPKVGRNEPRPCGSGKKFKKCCLNPR